MAKAIAMDEGSVMELNYDAEKLQAETRGNCTSIRMKVRALRGPFVNQEVRQELVDAGLEPWEVDYMIDDLYERPQEKLVLKAFAAARIRR